MPLNGPRNKEQAERLTPIKVLSRPDIVEIVARLAGEGFVTGQRGFDFNYAQIISILNNLTANRQLCAVMPDGRNVPASFILQELPQVQDSIYSAPVIPDQGRPQADTGQGGQDAEKVGIAK